MKSRQRLILKLKTFRHYFVSYDSPHKTLPVPRPYILYLPIHIHIKLVFAFRQFSLLKYICIFIINMYEVTKRDLIMDNKEARASFLKWKMKN